MSASNVEPSQEQAIFKVPKFNAVNGLLDPEFFAGIDIVPSEFHTAAQGMIARNTFKGSLVYSPPAGYFVFTGIKWEQSNDLALGMVESMSYEQLRRTSQALNAAQERVARLKEDRLAMLNSRSIVLPSTESILEADIRVAEQEAVKAQKLFSGASYMNQELCITTALKFTRANSYNVDLFDSDRYKLNTPDGTIDLRTGEIFPHNPSDMISKVTSVSPSVIGMDKWLDFLGNATLSNPELESFLQLAAGMFLLGKGDKLLVLAKGKANIFRSRFLKSCRLVMKDYACIIAPKVIANKGINIDNTLATLKGKRLVLSEESSSDKLIEANMVSLLDSTDQISENVKLIAPKDFKSTHALVMFTNKPASCLDRETFDKAIEIQFPPNSSAHKLLPSLDILLNEAGGAILQWMIDGAIRYNRQGCTLGKLPKCIGNAS
ncbi:MAG: hypothetical protein LBC41_02460 [Clostridiales bacterium]|jgi:hypothetical protein|nr:hypothetical protein [Clostridiales bacterium]